MSNEDKTEQKKDIFDRLFELRVFAFLQPFRRQLLYVFFGGVTTVINIGMFWLSNTGLGIHELLSNLIAWIVTMAVVYITNRKWVFESEACGFQAIIMEMIRFLAGRIFTLMLEEFLLFVFITILCWPAMPVKITSQVLVILINYFISRFLVFRGER